MNRRMIAILLLCALLCGLAACGKGDKKTPGETTDVKEMKIGVLFPDNANATGITHYLQLGIQKAAEAQKASAPVCKYGITDVSFDENEPVSATTAEQAETTDPPEPESYTTEDGEVVVRAVPIAQPKAESAVSAAADLIDQGCSVIVAADPIYDKLTAFLAKQFSDVTFLQYRGTQTELPNLQSFTENAYEAFYLAGAVAGCENVKRIGFTARTGSPDEIDCINAFALGAAKMNKNAEIYLRLTHVPLDLGLERTLPLALIEEDECALLAQSVFTALPVSVAAAADSEKKRDPLPCIGFGYDMKADGGSRYLCSVVFDFSVYFTEALQSIADGSFDASAYTGGVREGIVGLSSLQNASEKAKSTLQTLTEEYKNDKLHPLEGFKPAKSGYAKNVKLR